MRRPLSIPTRLKKQRRRPKQRGARRLRHLSVEPLEERRVLSLAAAGFDEQFQDLFHAPGGDAFVVPTDLVAPSEELSAFARESALPAGQGPAGATWEDPSEFMLGDVYVNVVLLESTGVSPRLTDNTTSDHSPQVSDGQVAWQGWDGSDWEVFLHDGVATRQLTDNSFDDMDPQTDAGQVVWVGDGEIFFYDGSTTRQLTSEPLTVRDPQIDNGQVVWVQDVWVPGEGQDYEIFLYDGSNTRQLTDNTSQDEYPQIHSGQVVWQGFDGNGTDYEIFVYDGVTTRQLTDNTTDDTSPKIHAGQVTWSGFDGDDWEIFLYDGATTRQLTSNYRADFVQDIDAGEVVWYGWDADAHDTEVFLYDGTTTRQLTDNETNDWDPRIDAGEVVWYGWSFGSANGIGSNEIFHFDGTTIRQLTDNATSDDQPQIDAGRIVWRHFDGSDDEILINADPSTEDWTATQIGQVKAKIAEGLTWWEDTLASYGSVHSLNFATDFTYADSPVPTRYEPINRPQSDQGLWIDDFLNSVGYNSPSSYFVDLAQFNHDQRIANNADWATTIFVVNSANDADGKFSDGYFAYAYLGGPFLVMTSDNNGWGIGRMGQVTAHEMGHIFYALDEYPGSGSYNDHSGYYNTQNLNAHDGNPDPTSRVPSIMAEASLQEIAWANHVTSSSSATMIGWQDTDSDGIFDVLDIPLTLTGTGGYNSASGLYDFDGTSSVQPLNNLNPFGSSHDITLNTVDRAQYQLDGGDWDTAQVYGSGAAALDLALGPFAVGTHTIGIRTIDDETGVTSSTFSDTFTVSGTSAIVGSTWKDQDGDGVKDAGEPGLEGWTIYLDADDDGVLDAAETSTATDGNGDYAFANLAPGTYTVREVSKTGWEQTAPATGSYSVTVASGEQVTGRDFGNFLGSIVVNSVLDKPDLDPGNGIVDTGVAGEVTLRAATMEANALAGPDTILLGAHTYRLTIAGTGEDAAATGDLDITDDLTIIGAGADSTIIDADQIDRVFHVVSSVTLHVSKVTITGGMVDDFSGDNDGGGLFNNSGMVRIADSIIDGNSALHGGGIASVSDLSISTSTISNNRAAYGDGGGILNHGTLTITDSGLISNTANRDGGAMSNTGTLTISNSTFSGNSAGTVGGAIANLVGGGTVTLTNSTVFANEAETGDALHNDQGIVQITNSIVFGSSSIADRSLVNDGTLTMTHSIGSHFINDGGNATLGDSTFTFLTANGGLVTFSGPVTVDDIDPVLGPLQDNGGPTFTHALLSGSPAIDAGNDDVLGLDPPIDTDQRGVARPQDGDGDGDATVDIGAFELFPDNLVIDVGEHVLLPDTPGQVIPVYVSGGAHVQGVVLNVQLHDGYPDVPRSTGDGPNISNVDLVGTGTVFGNIANSGNNVIESREQIWVVGTTTSDGVAAAEGMLAYVTIDTTGWLEGDGPWELKLAGTFNGDTNFQSPDGQIVPTIINGSVTIDNLPVANPGGPYSVDEGGSITLDGSASSDPDTGDSIVQYQWDLDGDSVYGETGDAAAQGDEVGVAPTFSAVDMDGPATWEIFLRVIDNHGAVSDPQGAFITVNNVAPVFGPVDDLTIHRVHSLDLQDLPVTFRDAGPLDVHTATVDWGDGSAPVSGVVVEPSGTNAGEVHATYAYAAGGSFVVTVTVQDDDGDSDTATFTVVVLDSQVVERYAVYNNSGWDGENPEANADDDNAIAPDKQALRPGQTATFANYTSYAKGLNSVAIDVSNLAGTLTEDDLQFLVGNNDDPSTWSPAPSPQSITVRPGAEVDDSDRVTIIWADDDPYTAEREPGSISKQWLQVTVLPTANTGLAEADVFYFGNAIGESGNSMAETNVDTNDEIRARNHPHSLLDLAPTDDAYDYDRDMRVDTNDEILARNNATSAFTRLQLITVPGTAAAANEASEDLDARLPASNSQAPTLLEAASPNLLPVVAYANKGKSESYESAPLSFAIVVGEHLLLADTPKQVIPVEVRGDLHVQGVVLNIEVADGYPDRPGSSKDGPNITDVNLLAPNAVFGKVSNTGQNFIETRQQIWVVGTSAASGTSLADGLLANVTIDTTGLDADDGPWELKLAGTINGDTNFQSPVGQINPWIENGVIRIVPANPWHNAAQPTDVNGDSFISPIDVLLVINRLNTQGSGTLPSIPMNSPAEVQFVDTNNDGVLSPLDVLLVINEINASVGDRSQSAGRGGAPTTVAGLVAKQDTTECHIVSQNHTPCSGLPASRPGSDQPIPQRGSCQSSATKIGQQSLWSDDADYLWLDSELEASLSDVAPDVLSVWST